MSDTVAILGELATLLTQEQLDRVTEHMRKMSGSVVPILVYLEMCGAHQESWELQVNLIEESVSNPSPWPESVIWSPVIDAWLSKHDAKLLIAPGGMTSINQAGELVVDQTGQLALFSADTPGEQGQPQVPLDIRNQWAYAQGQFDALLERRANRSSTETIVQDHLKRTVTEQAQKRAIGYARPELDNWKAYHAGEREPYLAEVRADYLSGYLSAWPSQPEDGSATHD